jgi:hypothetical protein
MFLLEIAKIAVPAGSILPLAPLYTATISFRRELNSRRRIFFSHKESPIENAARNRGVSVDKREQ